MTQHKILMVKLKGEPWSFLATVSVRGNRYQALTNWLGSQDSVCFYDAGPAEKMLNAIKTKKMTRIECFGSFCFTQTTLKNAKKAGITGLALVDYSQWEAWYEFSKKYIRR